jgi:hypothetical protein
MPLLLRRPVAALYVPVRGLLEARVPWGRDRALDHVVERERHLLPFLLTKDTLLMAVMGNTTENKNFCSSEHAQDHYGDAYKV